MIKVLQIFSILALLFAGFVVGLWVMDCFQVEPEIEQVMGPSIVEKFKQAGSRSDKNEKKEFE